MTVETFSLGACMVSGAILIAALSVAASFGLIQLTLWLACESWDTLVSLLLTDEYRRRLTRTIRKRFYEAHPTNAQQAGIREALRWYFENRERMTKP